MKILHHGYIYPNYNKCRSCGCEYLYDENDVVHLLYDDKITTPTVWTYCKCPECGNDDFVYYKGKIDKIRIYTSFDSKQYHEIDFDENTMERREI